MGAVVVRELFDPVDVFGAERRLVAVERRAVSVPPFVVILASKTPKIFGIWLSRPTLIVLLTDFLFFYA